MNYSLILITATLVTNVLSADTPMDEGTSDTINKEIYNFKSDNGTHVFTDMKPKSHKFNTQILKSSRSNPEPELNNRVTPHLYNDTEITKTTIIHQYENRPKKEKTKKKSKRRCEYLKERLELVNGKMKSGYRPSEYSKLEKKRIKYRKQVFNECDSRVN